MQGMCGKALSIFRVRRDKGVRKMDYDKMLIWTMRGVAVIAIIVFLTAMSVQVYQPVDCGRLFLKFQHNTNVTILHQDGSNAERWVDGNGFFIGQNDLVIPEEAVGFSTVCEGRRNENGNI